MGRRDLTENGLIAGHLALFSTVVESLAQAGRGIFGTLGFF